MMKSHELGKKNRFLMVLKSLKQVDLNSELNSELWILQTFGQVTGYSP